MTDNYAEQLVPRERTKADLLKSVGISVGAILIASVCMFFAIIIGFYTLVIFAVGALFGGIWFISRMNVEYEYIVTNNEMDIDKIIGKSKRKRMITVDLSAAEDFTEFSSEAEIEADVTVHATSGLEKDAHSLVINHKDYGKVNIIFNPNEKTREAIMQELPNALRMRLKHHVK